MKSYNFALTLTLYGVGLSLLMWSGRIISSCLMHRSLMSLRAGKVSFFLSSKKNYQDGKENKKTTIMSRMH